MNWIPFTQESQLNDILEESRKHPVVIFKHSTRCSISSMAKGRLERASEPENLPFYYLDLLKYRPLSNKIAEQLGIQHESPQILMLKDGQCIYHASHSGIDMDDIAKNATTC